ncbi:hypothetical protein DO021_07305 [Desulfobacter hydrogenophilus]|uniref:Uncharacterized protein n=1 Tax=Desulfobacter hydrogenophilus TaxID=2291 RepID=A0A328FIC1_9BACT|nr:hypothetical protein EYB58_03125 [Desulfobacter hydrogenophilus]RAM02695.1 hypothetical protein DO021_07305 [Desulfobacter hydrogenophilus]
MYRKKYSTVRKTQYGGGVGPSTDGYKGIRNSIGSYWESEGFIVPFEAKGQHNPGRRKGPYFVQATNERRIRRLHYAINSN